MEVDSIASLSSFGVPFSFWGESCNVLYTRQDWVSWCEPTILLEHNLSKSIWMWHHIWYIYIYICIKNKQHALDLLNPQCFRCFLLVLFWGVGDQIAESLPRFTFHNANNPCEWYMYLHENHKNKPNVGKYTLHGWYGIGDLNQNPCNNREGYIYMVPPLFDS